MAKDKIDINSIAWPLERLMRLMRGDAHDGALNPAQWEALRYLARANRFSDSPGALTRFLGSTKGTVSQTLKALQRKGLVTKTARENQRRSVSLTLTPDARAMLHNDPLLAFSETIDGLNGKSKRRLSKGLASLMDSELARQEQPRFGVCSTCRYYREKGGSVELAKPHACMLFDTSLSDGEAKLICIEHA